MKPFDPIGALELLVSRRVRFVLIGGLAARLHGSPTVTNDLDICHAKDPENLEALAATLTAMGARLRGAEDVDFPLDVRLLTAGENFTFTTDFGALDCLARPAGVPGYEQLHQRAEVMDLGDLRIAVASLDDLMAMKRAAGRPKDLIELEVLGALKREIEGDPSL